MPAGGSSIFTNVDGYQADLSDMMDLLVPRPRRFHAQLSWVELTHLGLLRAQEVLARVAYVSFPAGLNFVTFPTKSNSLLFCDGTALPFGEIMLHGQGDRLHQRTAGASSWGLIFLAPANLVAYGGIIAGRDLELPRVRQRLRPHAKDRNTLLRLHGQAGRMAETAPGRFGHNEVVRALEQDFLLALVNCLAATDRPDLVNTGHQERGMAVRLEEILSAKPHELLSVRDICDAIGETAQVLREYCSRALGMTIHRYQRLRRLKRVRAEILSADPMSCTFREILERYGFADIDGFMAEYWYAYREVPTIPSPLKVE